MKISIMLEGQQGLTWARWQQIATLTDQLGFAGLFRSDHFTDPNPPNRESLELMVSLTYLASQTRHIHFGPCVAPVSFRDPIMLVRQAMHINDLSGGRMILGLGAGWQQREHTMFGYPLGDVATRMARFEEALAVVTQLVRGSEPITFNGTFYQLQEAELLPRPASETPLRIMIGGNGMKRTLPLTAQYADIWNGVFLSPGEYRERTIALDTMLTANGRGPQAVRRTHMTALHYGKDITQLDHVLRWRYSRPELAGKSVEETVAVLREDARQVVGTPEAVTTQLQAYADAGVEELFLQWLDLDDLDGLRSFADRVLSQLV